MRQQVNLYQPAAPEGAQPFSAATMAVSAGLVVLCLLLFWGYGVKQVHALERTVETLRHQQEGGIPRVATGAQGLRADPAAMQSAVRQLDTDVAARRHALSLLRSGFVGRASGFSAHLEALARHPVKGLWIDHVTLSGTAPAMSVAGETLDPQLVPVYLRGLAAESALAGVRFDELRIERPVAGALQADSDEEPARLPSAGGAIRFRIDSETLRVKPGETS
jgi:hypothetical protein